MIKTHLPRFKKYLIFLTIALVSPLAYAFGPDAAEQEMLSWSNRCFTQSFDAAATGKLKKWELTLTEDAFIRLRKTYANGKQEYFSFHLQRFDDMDYLGTVTAGTLKLHTTDDDIIVQTYNDRKGNVDTMAAVLDIPVKNMEPERLDSLRNVLMYFKKKALN
ncbi:hypothetical protein EOD41_14210 [Mucilaginibacter limnophilus]|uniref:Uncharacterized protein n=1 Tax=Mucilaginibacter limnophilus TaxID=1932778 RepID=A0A3S2VLM2_9SPHI|nr:hypothetical protein [Mucilaginibacter limnophilus]RVU00110.1 hypothetical protein EOD41_14210 [Mucilaginibacter limnophilus]